MDNAASDLPTLEELQESIDELAAYRERLFQDVVGLGKKLRLSQKKIDATVAAHQELQRLDEVMSQLVAQRNAQQASLELQKIFINCIKLIFSKHKPMVQTLSPPMTMADFFKASHGTWLNVALCITTTIKMTKLPILILVIEPFNADDPVVIKICNSLNIKTEDSSGGARFWWESNTKKASQR